MYGEEPIDKVKKLMKFYEELSSCQRDKTRAEETMVRINNNINNHTGVVKALVSEEHPRKSYVVGKKIVIVEWVSKDCQRISMEDIEAIDVQR